MMNIREMADLERHDPQTRRALELVYEFADWLECQVQFETEDGHIGFKDEGGGPSWEDVERAYEAWRVQR